MDTKEQKQAVKPYVMKLKDLGMGLSMDRVLGDRVLIMPITPFTDADRVQKEGLLFIPETAKEANTPPPTVGEIIMIGPNVATLKVGEDVMFSRYAGMQINLNGVGMILLHENEIACVVKANNPDAVALIEEDRV